MGGAYYCDYEHNNMNKTRFFLVKKIFNLIFIKKIYISLFSIGLSTFITLVLRALVLKYIDFDVFDIVKHGFLPCFSVLFSLNSLR